MKHLERAELQIAKGKPLALIRESLKLHFEEVNYNNWLSEKQAEYDSLFKTKEVIISATTDNDEVIAEQVVYEYIDGCISFTEWLNETKKVLVGIETAIDANNVEYEKEIFENQLIHVYTKSDVTELVDEYLSSKYKEQRANEYPELPEQLDMLYKDMINGTDNWLELITNIKEKYPKV